MRPTDQGIGLSATDISGHLGCRHLTTLNHLLALGEIEKPQFQPATKVLQHRGLAHEAAYLDHLRAQGRTVVDLTSGGDFKDAALRTLEAMQRGDDVIAQATFLDGPWLGRADVLLKVPTPSDLGDWSYEVVDTKLAQKTKAGTILQLCLYSDLLARVQGRLPERTYVVVPRRDFEPETYVVNRYMAYYRLVKRQLLEAVAQPPHEAATYPTPCEHCSVCRYWKVCDERRRDDDHLSLVAGLGRQHEQQLTEWELPTVTDLATHEGDFPKPTRGRRPTYEKLRHQAQLQVASRDLDVPKFDLLPPEPGRGLARLPEPSPGDIFLDLEGDAFVEPRGLEYVIGWVTADPNSKYTTIWSMDDREEGRAFDQLMATIDDHWRRYPDFHIYHYAPYESAALKRMMGKHGRHEDAVDRLLRGKKLIDLYAVATQTLRAGVEKYSIKDLEPLYGFERELDLRDASRSRFAVETALELGKPEQISTERRNELEAYNRDDCISTLRLRGWLERLRTEQLAAGATIERPETPPPDAADTVAERQVRVDELRSKLLANVPVEPEQRSSAEHGQWLLAHLLDWFRRESKVVWWDFFHHAALSDDERFETSKALSGLQHVARFSESHGGTADCPVDRYRFPTQDVEQRGKDVWVDADTELGKLYALDTNAGHVDVKKKGDAKELHPESVFFFENIRAGVIEGALFRFAEAVIEHGIEGNGPLRAGRDLLLQNPPHLASPPGSKLRQPDETTLDCALRLAPQLDRGVLPIQGPPGAGKTFTGARMIVELVRQGKRVGITALSHKVIRNLLDETVAAADQTGFNLQCIQKVGKKRKAEDERIVETPSNKKVAEALHGGDAHVAAGTAWLWSRPELRNAVDVLVVDEAGQMALAMALAVSQAASSLVLIGDPQQLEQPMQGTHPEGADAAALHHLLAGDDTVAPERGLFLDDTWRLHPKICTFTSEAFYDGRLNPRPGLEQQRIDTPNLPLPTAGLTMFGVPHQGNQSSAPEEVEAIAALVEALTSGDGTWTDLHGAHHRIGLDDVLIVAPYNAQVMLLSERLPRARIGTVDKFQGQEAPIVIYSLTSSSPEDAPRGMEFLYSRNRLNVATSRARCLCVLVGSPALLTPECRTPRLIELANALCQFEEMSVSHEPELVAMKLEGSPA